MPLDKDAKSSSGDAILGFVALFIIVALAYWGLSACSDALFNSDVPSDSECDGWYEQSNNPNVLPQVRENAEALVEENCL